MVVLHTFVEASSSSSGTASCSCDLRMSAVSAVLLSVADASRCPASVRSCAAIARQVPSTAAFMQRSLMVWLSTSVTYSTTAFRRTCRTESC